MTVENASCVWLTTLRSDGSPHTTPVWFLLHENIFWIVSSTANAKVRNLAADPRVSIAVDGSASDDPRVAEGLATVHHEIERFDRLVRLFAVKYGGWDATDESLDGPRVLVEVRVTRWLLGPNRTHGGM
ncbi:PPOX class probable F420-dependent enzyme [Rhodococcus sp. 27YEA15]|uniref:nitroreductase/quinone reductase family protein n=1 Tax=Rhodococcus sp. 27YEA15 TaxID=3156259 RepID=UPI003C79884C